MVICVFFSVLGLTLGAGLIIEFVSVRDGLIIDYVSVRDGLIIAPTLRTHILGFEVSGYQSCSSDVLVGSNSLLLLLLRRKVELQQVEDSWP